LVDFRAIERVIIRAGAGAGVFATDGALAGDEGGTAFVGPLAFFACERSGDLIDDEGLVVGDKLARGPNRFASARPPDRLTCRRSEALPLAILPGVGFPTLRFASCWVTSCVVVAGEDVRLDDGIAGPARVDCVSGLFFQNVE